MLKIDLAQGSIARESKETLHIVTLAMNKAIDIFVIESRVLSLNKSISENPNLNLFYARNCGGGRS